MSTLLETLKEILQQRQAADMQEGIRGGWQPGMDLPAQPSAVPMPAPNIPRNSNAVVGRPDPQTTVERERLGALDSQMAQMDAPKQPEGFWMGLLKNSAQGLAYGDKLPQMRMQQQQLERQKRMDLAAEADRIRQGIGQRRQEQFQGEAADRAQAQEERAAAAFPLEQRTAEARLNAAQQPETPDTPFKQWMAQNPDAPVTDWIKANQNQASPPKPEAINTPFELWARQNPNGNVQDWFALSQPPKQDTDNEPLIPIMRDGKPVLVRRSQAEGAQPASNREQGRPVTSGDAGRIADFSTSIDDLEALKAAITETDKATGTRAAVGAALPAFVTDLTGWGVDAKKRQGVIDRVKQVIGKTLEGGVLRKEDEAKYERILPTIKDTPEIAKSKLEGLNKAITERRGTFVDTLQDSGFDVESHKARILGAPTTPPPAGGGRVIRFDKDGNRIP